MLDQALGVAQGDGDGDEAQTVDELHARLLAAAGVEIPSDLPEAAGTVVFVAWDGVFRGAIVVSDVCKPEAAGAIRAAAGTAFSMY